MTFEEPKTVLGTGGQILKTRDDYAPIFLSRASDSTGADRFTAPIDSTCSWAKPDQPFGVEMLRPRIEPWLTALVQSEHLSLLIGSGLTHAVHGLATTTARTGAMRRATSAESSMLPIRMAASKRSPMMSTSRSL